MKALIKDKTEKGVWLKEVKKPSPGPLEVLIKVRKTAICGTDLHLYKYDQWAKEDLKIPVILGHEFMGVIEEIGDNVQRFKVGDRVTAEGHLTCGKCRACLTGKRHLCPNTLGFGRHVNGAFAEYIVLPEENVILLPSFVSDEIGAILDPFGNAMHTALEFELTGKNVLITGAGPIGCMAAAIARRSGAKHVMITDLSDKRLMMAKEMGATHTVNIKHSRVRDLMKELEIETGFDVGMEMAGTAKSLRQLIDRLRPGAELSLLGIYPEEVTLNMNLIMFKSLTLKGIYGRKIFETWFQMFDFLKSGIDLTPVITHRLPYTDYEEGFELLLEGKGSKVILDWNS